MEYNLSKDEAEKIAQRTLERIEAEGVSKIPVNFGLFFCLYSKVSLDLKHAIEQVQANKERFTDELCKNLYEEYVDKSKRNQAALEEASDRIQSAIEQINETMLAASSQTKKFGGSLANASSDLGKADSLEALQKVIQTIASETKRMAVENKKLEEKLASSSTQVSELRDNLENVRKQALTDSLTGLGNRKCFDDEILKEIDLAELEGHKLSLLALDIDHFKSFNDNHGHQVGDQVLKLVAITIKNGIKGRDLAARYGGEEFMILLPETPLTAAVRVANILREKIAKKELVNRSANQSLGRITISVGVAEYQPGEPHDEFIRRADEALYAAKNGGRNRVEAANNPFINVHNKL